MNSITYCFLVFVIFVDQGDYVMTEIFFMNAPLEKFSLIGKEIMVNSLVARPIKI